MTRPVHNLSEREVQELIAEYPWLLSLDYESVPELKNRGMEKRVSDGKRVDLVLRDRRTGRPVLVEFKAVSLGRESIGQILEYRARFVQEMMMETSLLAEAFEEMVASPILILVAPSCAPEVRLACNLAGSEVYKYDKQVREWSKAETRKDFADFSASLTKGSGGIDFHLDRHQRIEMIYKEIREVVDGMGFDHSWVKFRYPSQEYFWQLNHFFLNMWLFKDERVSIGIYEDLFDAPHRFVLEFFAYSGEDLDTFVKSYRGESSNLESETEVQRESRWSYWSHELPKEDFLTKTKEASKPFLRDYKETMRSLGWFESET